VVVTPRDHCGSRDCTLIVFHSNPESGRCSGYPIAGRAFRRAESRHVACSRLLTLRCSPRVRPRHSEHAACFQRTPHSLSDLLKHRRLLHRCSRDEHSYPVLRGATRPSRFALANAAAYADRLRPGWVGAPTRRATSPHTCADGPGPPRASTPVE